jgi:hypothetical protein
MYSRVSRAYIFVPAVYVLVIFGLLLLQFAGGERVTRSVGQLVLQATRGATADVGSPGVAAVDLSFNGLRFSISEQSGIVVLAGGAERSLSVDRYEAQESGFALELSDGYELTTVTTTEPIEELQIRVSAPATASDVDEVIIPFSLGPDSSFSDTATSSFALVTTDTGQFYLTVPPGAQIDVERQIIQISPAALGSAVRYVAAVEGDTTQVRAWFEDPATSISAEQISARIDSFIDSAFLGWESGRYNQADLTWDQSEAAATFSEQALTAYLAEAWERGSYDRAFAEMRRAVDLHPEELGLLSSPYLGNLREVHRAQLEADTGRAAEIADRLAGADLTLFGEANILRFAATRAGEELYTDLIARMQSIDPRALDPATLIGLGANLFLAQAPDGRAASVANQLGTLIQQSILALIVRSDGAYYVQSSPGQIDVRISLVAGRVLEAIGLESDDTLLVRAGRNLIASALAQADINGMLPAALLLRGESAEPSGGGLPPEMVYELLDPPSAYPQVRSLYRQLGSGHWLFSAVPIQIAQLNEEEWEFIIEYPRLRTHYLTFFGIPEFTQMELFGQIWRNAPDFEIYSKGRHYEAETSSLLIKYYDDSVRGRIVLFY